MMKPTEMVEKLQDKFGNDNAVVLWKFNEQEEKWYSHSSHVPSELNDLREISQGDRLWVIVEDAESAYIKALVEFDGRDLVISLTDDRPKSHIRDSVFPGFGRDT